MLRPVALALELEALRASFVVGTPREPCAACDRPDPDLDVVVRRATSTRSWPRPVRSVPTSPRHGCCRCRDVHVDTAWDRSTSSSGVPGRGGRVGSRTCGWRHERADRAGGRSRSVCCARRPAGRRGARPVLRRPDHRGRATDGSAAPGRCSSTSASPWRRHLPLVELHGNAGSRWGDPPADAQYVEVRLSAYGEARPRRGSARRSARSRSGPRRGLLVRRRPGAPFDPGARRRSAARRMPPTRAVPSMPPVGSSATWTACSRAAGAAAPQCTISPVGGDLVITGLPLGVTGEEVLERIAQRANDYERGAGGRPPRRAIRRPAARSRDPHRPRPARRRTPAISLRRGRRLRAATEWLLDVRPVTTSATPGCPAR